MAMLENGQVVGKAEGIAILWYFSGRYTKLIPNFMFCFFRGTSPELAKRVIYCCQEMCCCQIGQVSLTSPLGVLSAS